MKPLIKNELHKAFCNKKFLLVLVIESIIVLWYTYVEVRPVITQQIPMLKEYLEPGSGIALPGAYYIWIGLNHCTQRILLYAVLPILTAIPYGASMFLDEKNHYTYNILIRTDRKKYYISKLVTLFISGGAVAIFPFVLSFLISTILLPLEYMNPTVRVFLGSITMYSELFYNYPLLYVLWYIVAIFCCYGLLNSLCFVAAYIFDNRFVVTIFPFAVYFITRVVGSVIFTGRNVTPWFFFRVDDFWRNDLPAATVQMLIMIGIVLLTFFVVSNKKGDKL